MTAFYRRPLSQKETIGEQFCSLRQSRHWTIAYLANISHISSQYLQALECGNYAQLPSALYARQYVKTLAGIFGVSWSILQPKLNEELRKMTSQKNIVSTASHHSLLSGSHNLRPLLIPRLMKRGIIGIGIFLIVVYFTWELAQFLSPPKLMITQPAEDAIVYTPTVVVNGTTTPESIVTMNGQDVAVAKNGTFAEEVTLRQGLNTLYIVAHSKHRRERMVIRNILFQKKESNTSGQ